MIYVAVALDAEARPLIAHLQLEKSDALEPLSVYRRSGLALIVALVVLPSMLVAATPPRSVDRLATERLADVLDEPERKVLVGV